MISPYVLLPLLVSFIVSLFFTPLWIRKAKQINLLWDDMNKSHQEKVSGSGGIITVLSFIVAILIFIAYRTFILRTQSFIVEVFALLTVVLFLAGIGFIDDLLGWQHGGLSIGSRLLLVLLAAIPLTVINAGKATVALPFDGLLDTGLLYPLILIPIGVIGAATTFNFLAGFNGLEAGQGILLLSAISMVAFFTGNSWLAVIGFCMVAALLGFIFYNWYPARVFPGDVLTYAVGGLIAVIAILGNFEKIAVFFFLPNILEVIFKSRGRFLKYSFGKPNGEGTLDLRYDKLYSLNHVAIYLMKKMHIRPTEKKVVCSILGLQLIVILVGLVIFRKGIF